MSNSSKSPNQYIYDELEKLNTLVDYFNFNMENSTDFDPWYPVFCQSVEKYLGENFRKVDIDLFVNYIKNNFDEKTFKKRLQNNEYLMYEEVLKTEKKSK